MIQHTVSFSLKHSPGSDAEVAFLDATLQLTQIPGVLEFKRLRQTSKQSPFLFSLSMCFTNQVAYANYNAHPLHKIFVEERWLTEVKEFQELDFEAY